MHEPGSIECQNILVRVAGEVARRIKSLAVDESVLRDTSPDDDQKERTWSKYPGDLAEDIGQLGWWNMDERIHGQGGIEGIIGERQRSEIGYEGMYSPCLCRLDIGRREINRCDIEVEIARYRASWPVPQPSSRTDSTPAAEILSANASMISVRHLDGIVAALRLPSAS